MGVFTIPGLTINPLLSTLNPGFNNKKNIRLKNILRISNIILGNIILTSSTAANKNIYVKS